MAGHKQEPKLVKNSTSITQQRVLEIRAEAETLREQIQNLKQKLRYKTQQLKEAQQELRYTNNQRHEINNESCASLLLESLPLDEAKELAKEILTTQQSASESLDELLAAIYNSTVEVSELEQGQTLTSLSLALQEG